MLVPHDAGRRKGSPGRKGSLSAAPEGDREPDAPVRIARREVSLCPSALGKVSDPQRVGRELKRLLQERLDDTSDIEVSVTDDCVVLHGIVSCPLARLLAEDLAYSMPDVWECRNELVVRTDDGAVSAA